MPVIRGPNPTVTDSLAAIVPAPAAIGRPTATARRLVNASVSANTRRAYASALGQLDAWLDGRPLDDAALAAYLAQLHDASDADGILVTIRRSKTHQAGETSAVRYLKIGPARAGRPGPSRSAGGRRAAGRPRGHGQWVDAAGPLARAAAIRGQITMRSISSTVSVSPVRS